MLGPKYTCRAPAGSSSIPTNGIVGSDDLIRVAVVRDPRQAVPISGTWTGFPSDHLGMTVEVEVTAEAEAKAAPKGQESRTAG
jgi:hypothetical protein